MTVKLGERSYVFDLDRLTFQQAHYLMRQVRLAGLDAIWPIEGESDEAYGERIRAGILQAGNIPEVLAGYLVPDGETWSPAAAKVTARRLAELTDPADHTTLLELAQRVAPDFFVRALDWYGISRLSLNGALAPEPSAISAH